MPHTSPKIREDINQGKYMRLVVDDSHNSEGKQVRRTFRAHEDVDADIQAEATPPFLHNGSVASLYELLRSAAERHVTFFIRREFDPGKVGVDTSGRSGKFLLHTRLVGNSNAGHSFDAGQRANGIIGRLPTDQGRWNIIEYIKSIPTEPGQVTPYGEPDDPVGAHLDDDFFDNRGAAQY
jgi:hypothetical protein